MNDKIKRLMENLNSVIRGKEEAVRLLSAAFFAGGNILLEDVPGVGKTTLAKTLALSIKGDFSRIQFTPDLLPSDILGCSIFNPSSAEFVFRKGPVFTNILLADEINRASPRTQSALLEAMNEGQATIEGKTHPLPKPFLVIATENPVEHHGTYPLPEAQLDRFAMRLSLGYPDEAHELEMLYSRKDSDPLENIRPVLEKDEVAAIQAEVGKVSVERSVAEYMARLVRATRNDPRVRLGASPRALLTLSRCARGLAFTDGRRHTLPDDVKTLAIPVLSHRLSLDNKAKYSGVKASDVIVEILKNTDVPA